MDEIIFFAEKNETGRYKATLPGANITEEADTVKELKDAIKRLYEAHFPPKLIRLYFAKERYDITFYTVTESLRLCV